MIITDGDPIIRIKENGGDITYTDGQTDMDVFISNAILISLFTREGYWANDLEKKESGKIGVGYEESLHAPITSSNINNMEAKARESLKILKDENIIKDLDVSITNPVTDRLLIAITLVDKFGGTNNYNFSYNGRGERA